METLSPEARTHVDEVLEAYAGLTGTQLEDMTHKEDPWITARRGYRSTQRCEVVIEMTLMRDYYAAQIVNES